MSEDNKVLDFERLRPHTPLTVAGLELGGVADRVLDVKGGRIGHRHDMPADVVYIGRDVPSHFLPDAVAAMAKGWGNPFKLEYESELARARCLLRYLDHMIDEMRKHEELRKQVYRLREKRLLCWCSPQLCHGHFLATLSEQSDKLTPISGVEGDVTMVEWELAADLLRLNLKAAIEQRGYTAERVFGGLDSRNSAGFPTNAIKLTSRYTTQSFSLLNPEGIHTRYILAKKPRWQKRDNLWECLRAFAGEEGDRPVSLWVDGQESGWLRLRVMQAEQDTFCGKILIDPLPLLDRKDEMVKFLTHYHH
jgi:hypothetical protein